MKTDSLALKPASFGTVSHGTLRSADLLNAFISEGEWQQSRNGAFLSTPAGFPVRDALTKLIGEAQDCFDSEGEEIDAEKDEIASEVVNDFIDFFSEHFAPSYGYFGTLEGDGSDFGYWVDIDNVKEQVGFSSSTDQEQPDADFQGEWLHVNERGNCALYVRNADGSDTEIWSIV